VESIQARPKIVSTSISFVARPPRDVAAFCGAINSRPAFINTSGKRTCGGALKSTRMTPGGHGQPTFRVVFLVCRQITILAGCWLGASPWQAIMGQERGDAQSLGRACASFLHSRDNGRTISPAGNSFEFQAVLGFSDL